MRKIIVYHIGRYCPKRYRVGRSGCAGFAAALQVFGLLPSKKTKFLLQNFGLIYPAIPEIGQVTLTVEKNLTFEVSFRFISHSIQIERYT